MEQIVPSSLLYSKYNQIPNFPAYILNDSTAPRGSKVLYSNNISKYDNTTGKFHTRGGKTLI